MSIGFMNIFQDISLCFNVFINSTVYKHIFIILIGRKQNAPTNSPIAPGGGYPIRARAVVSAVSTEKNKKENSRNLLTRKIFNDIIDLQIKEVITMTTQEIIKELMVKDNKSNARFASELEITQAALWDRLNNTKRKDLSVSVLSKMVRLLGYKIQIVPLNKQKPDDGYEL